MKKPFIVIIWVIVILFGVIGLITFFVVLLNPIYFNCSGKIDTALANSFGQFFGGLVGTIFSITSTLLILLTIILQNIDSKKKQTEEHFFKMLDYHNENVRLLNVKHIENLKGKSEGRRAFVVFRIQLKGLIKIVRDINTTLKLNLQDKEIIDIAYVCFYYGIDDDEDWNKEFEQKISLVTNEGLDFANLIRSIKYEIKSKENINIGRTNQTSLSSYYRNMYNAIKLIDEDEYLTKTEKKKLITIYRAQLSNPELYVLFMSLMSRFGKNWEEKNFILKYEFIKNLPLNYCDDINPKDYFPMEYEDEELINQ